MRRPAGSHTGTTLSWRTALCKPRHPFRAATRHVSDKGAWHTLGRRYRQHHQRRPHDACIIVRPILEIRLPSATTGHCGSYEGCFRSLSRHITMLASVEGPLTRRLIYSHRPAALLGTGRTELEARHWPQTLALLSFPPPAGNASLFGLHHSSGATWPPSFSCSVDDPGEHALLGLDVV
jgi:hypothetical protein